MANAPAYPVEYVEVAGHRVRVFCRHEFLYRRWNYKPGQRVGFIAPSQDGKTTLAFQLLMVTAHAGMPAYVLVMKPVDPTPAAWTRYLGYEETPVWPPPPRRLFDNRPPPAGYTVWPPHTFNIAIDNRLQQVVFSATLNHVYRHNAGKNGKPAIVFADEAFGIMAELPDPIAKEESTLTDQLLAISMRGGGMGVGLWWAHQKPTGTQGKGLPGLLISNTEKLFLSRDPDKRSRERYAEIGGIDPDLTYQLVSGLRRHQFVAIDKGDGDGGPYVSVVDAR